MNQIIFFCAITFIILRRGYVLFQYYKRTHYAVVGEYYINRLCDAIIVKVVKKCDGVVYYNHVYENLKYPAKVYHSSEREFFINHKADY